MCVCVRARVVLFLGLNGSVSFPAAFRVLPFCMVSCPLRDGGMCDLALNDDDGNMVRRQEKKMEERITSPPSPSFFFYFLNMLWSISYAFSLSCETFLFEFCVQLCFSVFFFSTFAVSSYLTMFRFSTPHLHLAAVCSDWGNCHRNEHLFLLHF